MTGTGIGTWEKEGDGFLGFFLNIYFESSGASDEMR
jgi:hypothetical protein